MEGILDDATAVTAWAWLGCNVLNGIATNRFGDSYRLGMVRLQPSTGLRHPPSILCYRLGMVRLQHRLRFSVRPAAVSYRLGMVRLQQFCKSFHKVPTSVTAWAWLGCNSALISFACTPIQRYRLGMVRLQLQTGYIEPVNATVVTAWAWLGCNRAWI